MSNARYYARRDAGLCPQCGVTVAAGVYCPDHRRIHRERVTRDRRADRLNYNAYMRWYRALGRDTVQLMTPEQAP